MSYIIITVLVGQFHAIHCHSTMKVGYYAKFYIIFKTAEEHNCSSCAVIHQLLSVFLLFINFFIVFTGISTVQGDDIMAFSRMELVTQIFNFDIHAVRLYEFTLLKTSKFKTRFRN